MEKPAVVPKVIGADIECSNFQDGQEFSDHFASHAVHAQFEGLSRSELTGFSSYAFPRAIDTRSDYERALSPDEGQEQLRKFLDNGAAATIDLNKLEVCTPEVRGVLDHIGVVHALFRRTRAAQAAANAGLPADKRIVVLFNNTDATHEISFGAHTNIFLSSRAWNDVCGEAPHYLLMLASHQVTSLPLTGPGVVVPDGGSGTFQLSARARFMRQISSLETTHSRGIVNLRGQPLCGRQPGLARLHCIFYDTNLSQVSILLKTGLLQIVCAMIEARWPVDPETLLWDPVDAVQAINCDLTFAEKFRTITGRPTTALDLQRRLCHQARKFAATGALDGIVPDYSLILELWAQTIDWLKQHAKHRVDLAHRLDWCCKLNIIGTAISRHRHLTLSSPQIQIVDQLYASAGEDGLYWDREHAMERYVTDTRIAEFEHAPPDDTRAWGRTALIQKFRAQICDVDWDSLEFHPANGRAYGSRRRLRLGSPVDFTRADVGERLERAAGPEEFGALLEDLGATDLLAGATAYSVRNVSAYE